MFVYFVISLVIAVSLGLQYFILVISSVFCLCFSLLARRLAGKIVPKITYFVFIE